MTAPVFLRQAFRDPGRRYQLVHAESGAVLGSRVEITAEGRPWGRRARRDPAQEPESELLVAPVRWTHTCFAPGPVDVVFVDAGGTILKTCRWVRPWRVVGARGAHAFIEGPPGFIERTWTSVGDRLALREAQATRPARDITPLRPGFEQIPDAVRAALWNSMPGMPEEIDAGSDPWDIGTEEVAAAELTASAPPRASQPAPAASLGHLRAEARIPAPPRQTPAGPAPQQTSAPPAPRQTPAPPAPRRSPASSAPRQTPALSPPRQTPAPPAPRQTPVLSAARQTPAPLAPRQTPAPSAPRQRPALPAFSTGVDLVRLVARRTPLAWFECVAIVQELHAVLLARGEVQTPCNLEAGDVAITADGGIELRRDLLPGLPPVPQAARILLTLLGEAQTLPVQLRLLVLQEVSPSPICPTILEFSTQLALYERPGRQAVIRDVYARFSQLPRREAESRVTPPREAESRIAAAPPAALTAWEPLPWWRTRLVHALAGAVALMVIAGVAAMWLRPDVAPPGPGSTTDRGPVVREVAAAGDPVPEAAAGSAKTAIRPAPGSPADRGPLARGVATAVDSVSEAAAGSARTVARWLGVGATDRPSAAPPSDTPATPAPAAPEPAPTRLTRSAKPAPPRSGSAPAGSAPIGRAPADPAPPDSTVYSPVDTEVAPPSLVRTRLPSAPSPGFSTGEPPEVEVVVSPAGEVESVKLLGQPTGVSPAMMLSAIKNWRFHPATRDGQPVRYRLVMRLTNQ